jgi:hypothetical protein
MYIVVGADAPTTKRKFRSNYQILTSYAPPRPNTMHPRSQPTCAGLPAQRPAGSIHSGETGQWAIVHRAAQRLSLFLSSKSQKVNHQNKVLHNCWLLFAQIQGFMYKCKTETSRAHLLFCEHLQEFFETHSLNHHLYKNYSLYLYPHSRELILFSIFG